MNLGNLGAIGTGLQTGFADAQRQAMLIQQEQMKLDEAKRQLQARTAAGAGLMQPMQMPPQGPQAPPPGQASQPRAVPGLPPAGGAPGAPGGAPASGGGGMPPGIPGVAPGMQQGAPMGGGMGMPPGNAPDQMMQAIAQRIKNANPGIDPGTLWEAVKAHADMLVQLQPYQRDQIKDMADMMSYSAKVQKIENDAQMAIQRAQSAAEVAEIKATTAQMIANLRDSTTRRGQDMRFDASQARTDLQRELGTGRLALDEKKIQNTEWYRENLVRLKDAGLSQRTAEAEMRERIAQLRDDTTRRGQDLAHEDRQGALDVRLQQVQNTKEYRDAIVALKNKGLDQTAAENEIRNRLRERGLDITERATGVRLDQGQQNIDLKRELAALADETRRRGQDMTADTARAKLAEHPVMVKIRNINHDIDRLYGTNAGMKPSQSTQRQIDALQAERTRQVQQLEAAGYSKDEIAKELRSGGAKAPPQSNGVTVPVSRDGTPAQEELPPQARAQLREGAETTFNNGQVWTLQNGQPKRVR